MKTFSYSELCDIEVILQQQLINCQNALESWKNNPKSKVFKMAADDVVQSQKLLYRVIEVKREYFNQTAPK